MTRDGVLEMKGGGHRLAAEKTLLPEFTHMVLPHHPSLDPLRVVLNPSNAGELMCISMAPVPAYLTQMADQL
jgi:hypothetical protein